MKSINSFITFLVLGFSALHLTACEKQTEPAKRALDEVDNIVSQATADGTKYFPDQMASVQKELGELQSSHDQKDYATVLAHAPTVLVDAKALAAAATTIASGDVDNAIATAKDVRSEIEAAAAALRVELPGAGFATLWLVLASGLTPQHGAAAVPNAGPMEHRAKEATRASHTRLDTSAARLDTDSEIALNAVLQRKLALTLERLSVRKQELRWTVIIIALAGIVVALLTWMLITNLRYRRELLRLAEEDSLTCLPNRRRTVEQATAALASAAIVHRPVTIALIDLDHFKSINDRCGHAVGDRVLKEFARLTREVLRASDTLGRWGGEEFLLILPNTEIDSAVAILNRMRTAIADIQLPETVCGSCVSFSAGLATRTRNVQSLDEVIASADAALYEAKSAGRNKLRLDNETYRAAASGVLRALYDRV